MKTKKIRTPQTAVQMCELITMIVEKRPDRTGEQILNLFVSGSSNHSRATGELQAKGLLPMTDEERELHQTLMKFLDDITQPKQQGVD